ncbi:MAG: hypothetical protein KKC68_03195 [Candidatus Thermoplasmatota archaeon]|nr:hypothetical protein [Candidatus Thermoplasmatota archaeon]MBU1940758.1 hypothetical protein [Candidatus Thermoplasmatota archaeon]
MTTQPTTTPEQNIILIRYGELFLKSTYVRNHFEQTLINNIQTSLKKTEIPARITRDRGRIYLHTPHIPQTLPILTHIFGITSISPATTTPATIKHISSTALTLLQPYLTPTTSFALRVTRSGTHTFTSQDMATAIGNDIVQATHAPVNLTHPDIELFIEIRDKNAYLFTQKITGPGGLPLGTQGTILTLISHKTDLLAMWYLIRRGCNPLIALTNTTLQPEIHSFLTTWHTTTPIHFITPDPPTQYQELNTLAETHHCNAIITGHTLETTTLAQLHTLKTSLTTPVLHPLIALKPEDIIKKATEVGLCL